MATERGQHDVVAIAAVIADREPLAGNREMGAFGKPGEVTDDRVAAIAKDGRPCRRGSSFQSTGIHPRRGLMISSVCE